MRQFSHFIRRLVRAESSYVLTEPRELSVHELWLLDGWYNDRLWKNTGYRAKAATLYDGFGWSLKKYCRRYAVESEAISISDMMRFLIGKGHRIEAGLGHIYVVGVESVLFGKAYPIDYYEGSGP